MVPDPVTTMVEELRRRGVAHEITRQVAAVIRREYGGSQCYIRTVDREERNQHVEQLLELGASPKAIAKVTGLSASTIRRRRSMWL